MEVFEHKSKDKMTNSGELGCIYVMTINLLKTLQEYFPVSHPYVRSQGYADIAEILLQIESMRNVNMTTQIQTHETYGTVRLKDKTERITNYYCNNQSN